MKRLLFDKSNKVWTLKYKQYIISIDSETINYCIHNTRSGRKYVNTFQYKNTRSLLKALKRRLFGMGILEKETREFRL